MNTSTGHTGTNGPTTGETAVPAPTTPDDDLRQVYGHRGSGEVIRNTDAVVGQYRCADGVGCAEVVDRARAAELARYVFGEREQADRLLTAAQRWAALHDYGNNTDVAVDP